MAIRFSEGLRDKMLGSADLKTAFTNGVLRIYSGVQPTSANNAKTGTLLLEVTVVGLTFTHGVATNGLNFDAPSEGIIAKAVAEAWQGNGITDGVAGWGRLSGNPLDDGTSSTTLARIDVAVAKTGGDLNLSNTTIVNGAPTTVDVFQLTMLEQ